MLIEMKAYLQQHRFANLAALVHHMKIAPEQARQLLSHWINKGKVRKVSKTPRCGKTCNLCDPLLTEYYEWVE